MKIAVAKYPIDAPLRFDDFADKQSRWLHEASSADASGEISARARATARVEGTGDRRCVLGMGVARS